MGLLEWGNELNGFRACEGGDRLALDGEAPALHDVAASYVKLRLPPYEPVYVELTGRRRQLPGGAIQFTIASLETMRVRGPNDCPTLPPNPKRPPSPTKRGMQTDR